MTQLADIRPFIQSLIDGVSRTFAVEAAAFDAESRLVAWTDAYLRRKGNVVHAPSIEEVMRNETVVVNRPGFMLSCEGCRFRENCPSTIEILSSIRIGALPIGAMALTSFSKEGHDRITQNIPEYTRILSELTRLVSDAADLRQQSGGYGRLEGLLQAAVDASDNGLLVTDATGVIQYANEAAIGSLSYCSLFSQALDQVFPPEIVRPILAAQPVEGELCRLGDAVARIWARPAFTDGRYAGSLVRIGPGASRQRQPGRQREIDLRERSSLQQLKGSHPSILALKERIRKVARSSSTVLITGETGSGKGLVAKAIHYESARAGGPFVAVNCASIPSTLFESELFGYEEGAFTGAKRGGKPGLFELADRGTLFLDEVAEMPTYIQAKLLKVLQDHVVERVGGTRPIAVDVRIVAATNKELGPMIEQGSFRSDLFYRLNVVPLEVPSLAEHASDLPQLAEEFLKVQAKRQKETVKTLAPEVLAALCAYPWPGNIRELENVLEYAVNVEDGPVIRPESLPEVFWRRMPDVSEATALLSALDRHGWDLAGKQAAARELSISLRTLYRRLARLGLAAERRRQ